jgi:hypothetical protein
MRSKTYPVLLFAIALAALLFFLILEVRKASTLGFPLDDSWIFWVFARNLATGQGFSFNPGQPVFGTTSILWVLVLAGSYLATHSVVLISKIWGGVFFLFSIFFTYKICLFYTEQKRTAFFAVLGVALAPPLIHGALSGMEIPLATFLLCLTLYFHLKEKGKGKKIFLAPILGALCFAARPELISLYPLLLIHDCVNRKNGEDQVAQVIPWSTILKKAFTFVIFLSPAFIFGYLMTGSLLPNTLAAKTLDSGLIWAIRNGSMNELIVSLTLNPLVWGGTMLAVLVFLNVSWAFFWGRGLLLCLLRKETLIYPLLFLLIPVLRGIVAPVGHSFTQEFRYVSFLFPVLAVFFVAGWGGLDSGEGDKILSGSLRRWLLLAAGVSLILTLVFYANPLVKRDALLQLFSRYSLPSFRGKSALTNFGDFKFIFWFSVFFIAFVNLLGTFKSFIKSPPGRKVLYSLLIAGLVLQTGFLVNQAERHALSVKNINDMQVHLGKWVNRNIPRRSLVAINDVGAIKFFGKRECFDLEGLVSPQILPYKILAYGGDSYIVYLNRHRPDYFVILPLWYPSLVRYLGLEKGVLHQIQLADNIVVSGKGYAIAAKPDWELFDSTFQNTGLLDIEPYVPQKSVRRRWFDAQEHQGLPPDWRVYQIKGRVAERREDFKEAEKHYLKAESYDPQHHEFYLQIGRFYEKQGEQVRARTAFEKSINYRLFPPN